MTREARLQHAKDTRWVERYRGNNISKGYRKWFGVDPLCAVIELRLLGVPISDAAENQIKVSIDALATARKKKKAAAERQLEELYGDSDATFAFIAGYTPGGAPYGLTWEELDERPLCEDGE